MKKNKCLCVCHENTLNKPYEHDSACCEKMNGFIPPKEKIEEFEEDFEFILGEYWYERTPLEKERWFDSLRNFFRRQTILECLEKIKPEEININSSENISKEELASRAYYAAISQSKTNLNNLNKKI
jgi:hypothetical protein